MDATAHGAAPASLDGELIPQAPRDAVDPDNLVYHRLCRADEFSEGEGKP